MDKAQRARLWSFAAGPIAGIVAGADYGLIARLLFGFPMALMGDLEERSCEVVARPAEAAAAGQ